MVQIVENWADVTGSVRRIGPSGKGPAFATVALEVREVADVEGFPNLVAETAGRTLELIVPSDAVTAADVAEGAEVRCRVRKASPFEVFAGPDGLRVCG